MQNQSLCWIAHEYSQVWQKRLLLFKFAIYFPHFVCSHPPFRYLFALTGTLAAGNKLMLIYADSEHTAQHTAPLVRFIHTAFTMLVFRI